jgi:hypothetical protein
MDRSRIAAAVPDAAFATAPDGVAGADLVIVDLGGHAGAIPVVRHLVPNARIVAFGRHDNVAALEQARADGADLAVPRSRFFRDPVEAIAPERHP